MRGFPKITGLVLLCLLSSCYTKGIQMKLDGEMAIQSMIEIKKAQDKYKASTGRYGDLKELAAAGLIKADLTRDAYRGHRYEIRANRDTYEAFARPLDPEEASFFLDESGRIRFSLNKGKDANKNDTPVAGS